MTAEIRSIFEKKPFERRHLRAGDDGDTEIGGRVEGVVSGETLTVRAKAEIIGDILGDTVVVNGYLKGRLHARSVVIGPSARIEGEVHYETIVIHPSAQVEALCRHIAPLPVAAE